MGDAGRSSRQISCLIKEDCHEGNNAQNHQYINDHAYDHAIDMAGLCRRRFT